MQPSQSTGNIQTKASESKPAYSRSQLEASAAGKDDFFKRKQAVRQARLGLKSSHSKTVHAGSNQQ